MGSHMLADLCPHGEQGALPLVVAGPTHVGFTEITHDDRPVNGRDDLAERELLGIAGQDVAASDTTLGAHQSGTLQSEQYLLEVRLREPRAFGDVTHRRG